MKLFTRREMLRKIGTGTAIAATTPMQLWTMNNKKTHYITLSFDDGFKKSSIRTAEIYEKHNLSACINVVATAHHPDFVLPNEYHRWPAGDFKLWNELQARGHEIGMHGYKHVNKSMISFEEGKNLILKCIDYFSRNLNGFDAKTSVFNFPHNASTPQLEEWLPSKVMSYRTAGPPVNPLPHKVQAKLTCGTHGPENIEAVLDGEIETWLSQPSGWFIYNTHGLDDEGWGPIRAEYLDHLLGRLTKIEKVKIITAREALITNK